MRLLRLRLEAFGPYGEGDLIDFRALRYSKLFLIHGPVGSGKTFLLDGICFALYGRSSGGERSRADLRNLSAPPDKETSASLDFECHNQNYRVERRFSLESLDGGEDEVTLWRLPEIGNPTRRDILSSTAGGVEAMITKLFGLTAEQFCQVAILPQGRFREFLLAEGDQRRQILANMFNSARHARLQAMLVKEHLAVKRLLEAAWKEREHLNQTYHHSGGDPRESLHRSQEELKAVDQSCRRHQERSSGWERSLEEAVRYETLDRQRDVSQRELRVLTEEEESPEDALAARLKKCLPQFERWRSIQEEAEVIGAELKEQRAQYERLKSNTNFLEEEVERARRLEEEKFSLRRSVERLNILVDDCQGVEVLSDELSKTSERLEELARKRAELAVVVKSDKARVLELEEELEKIEEAEDKLERLKRNLEAVSARQGRIRQNEVLRETYEQSVTREERFQVLVDELEDERAQLRKQASKQKERDLTDALHLLKDQLRTDEECPLCGSIEHPSPFNARKRRRRGGDEENEEALENVARRLEMARKELASARERTARLEGRLEEREEDEEGAEIDEKTLLSLRQTVEAVEARVSRKDSLLKELRRLRQASKPDRMKLKKMRLLKERLEATLETISLQQQARKESLQDTMTELFPQLARVDFEELSDFISGEQVRLNERLEELAEVQFSTERAELMAETFALQLAETRASEKRRDALLAESAALKRELEEKFRLEFAGWDDLSFSLGRLARESNLQSQGTVLDRETLVATIERQLNQSRELLATLPVPQMKAEQIRNALAREREHLELKVGRRAALEKSVEQSAEDVARYDSLVERIRAHETRLNHLERMGRLATGTGGTDFHDWYLDRVFRKVIEAANLRLEVLAPNRFCLELHGGLEVRIFDFQAAKERAATTLSGGESFLASLALALGFGDILQADRVARERLQTLFIDEGFGYLDRRALEAAMDCLESLKQEGRTVGIISHVPTLRERIRAQVVVASNDSPLPYGVERVEIFAE